MDLLESDPLPLVRTVNVGITGHRASILPDGVSGALEAAVDEVFSGLRAAAVKVRSAKEARLRLHTPLASGADQLAAKSAHASGYDVRALLPFEVDEYRKDFADGDELDQFEHALNAAHEIHALPGKRSDEIGAYVTVGEAVIEAADILVAIWDGAEGRGPGGTAHVVGLALANSMPVIHVVIDRENETVATRLLVGGDATQPIARSFSGPRAYRALLRDTLAPVQRARAG